MSKIKIEEILKKKIPVLYEKCYSEDSRKRLKAAIKEIVEAVVDKCAEEAIISSRNESEYQGSLGNEAGLLYADKEYTEVDKESILKVKTEISYE